MRENNAHEIKLSIHNSHGWQAKTEITCQRNSHGAKKNACE